MSFPRLSNLCWFLLSLAAPVFVAVGIARWHVLYPVADTWAYVRWHFEVADGGWNWGQFFLPHNEHLLSIPRQIFSWGLQVLGTRSWLVCYFSWLASVVSLLSIAWLARRQRGPWLLPMLALVSLLVFSPSQASTWTWEMVFGNFFPPALLCLGLVIRRSPWSLGVQLPVLIVLSVMAVFSAGCGFLMPLLLALDTWWEGATAQRSRQEQWLEISILLLTGLALMVCQWLLTRDGLREPSALGGSYLRKNPLLTLQFYTLLCGINFAWGTDVEPQVIGAVLGALLLSLFLGSIAYVAWRRDAELRRASAPWLCLGLFSLGTGALVTISRMHATWIPAYSERYITYLLFLPVAVLFLVPLVLRDLVRKFPHWERDLLQGQCLAGGLLLALLLTTFSSATERLQWNHQSRLQDQAALYWALLFPQETGKLMDDEVHAFGPLAQRMTRAGMLPPDTLATDATLASWKPSEQPLDPDRGLFEILSPQADGSLLAAGSALLPVVKRPPDAIVITASPDGLQPGPILTLGFPTLPISYYHRELWRKVERPLYEAWSLNIPSHALSTHPQFLQAWAIDIESHKARRLSQVWSVDAGLLRVAHP